MVILTTLFGRIRVTLRRSPRRQEEWFKFPFWELATSDPRSNPPNSKCVAGDSLLHS